MTPGSRMGDGSAVISGSDQTRTGRAAHCFEGLFPETAWWRVRYFGGTDPMPDLTDWPELDEVTATYLGQIR